jgi:phage-related protein
MTGTNDLWEVRVTLAGNIFRLLGFYDGTRTLVLSHGFTKKTQKTPPREIEVAERRKHEYENR